MVAFIVLLFAALSRLVPHALHGIGLNFTAVGGGLLYFGARRPRWQAAIALAAMALTDVYLTVFVYGATFHLRDYLVTWAWYAGVCLLASQLLRRRTTARVILAVFCSATSFFALSNLMVWFGSGMYAHTPAGFVACYVAALPFYANDLVSTALVSTVLFGFPAMAAQFVGAWRQVKGSQQPLA